jgi:hypothetical protein
VEVLPENLELRILRQFPCHFNTVLKRLRYFRMLSSNPLSTRVTINVKAANMAANAKEFCPTAYLSWNGIKYDSMSMKLGAEAGAGSRGKEATPLVPGGPTHRERQGVARWEEPFTPEPSTFSGNNCSLRSRVVKS